jgi:hypothetical protein
MTMPDQNTDYPNLRQYLHPSYQNVSDRRIEALLARNNMDAEAMEGFFDGLSSFASSAGKALLQAAPSILPIAGTIAGAAIGGPAGMQIGSSLGSIAGQLAGAATGQAPPAQMPPAQMPPGQAAVPGPVSAAPGLGALSGILGSPAAGQLLQTLLKPETMQALGSLAMGAMGKPDVSVGGTPVPVGAFANLLKTLATQTEAESNAMTRSATLAYMQDFAGEAKADQTVAQNRAAVLYEMLLSSDSEQESSEGVEGGEAEALNEAEALEAEYEELAEAYDEAYEFEEA